MEITLGQLLQYLDKESDPIDRVQIVTEEQDWEDAAEVTINSELLVPFLDRRIMFMGIDESYRDRRAVIRATIASCK